MRVQDKQDTVILAVAAKPDNDQCLVNGRDLGCTEWWIFGTGLESRSEVIVRYLDCTGLIDEVLSRQTEDGKY